MKKASAAEKLRLFIENADLSQSDAAAHIGCHQGTLSKLLGKKIKSPDISLLVGVERFTNGKVKCQDWAK